jgi:glycosyltransferase involved in cell wall biosynthesis
MLHAPTFGVLLVTNKLENTPAGGRELLCRLNHNVLKDIYGERLSVLELNKVAISGVHSVANSFRGFIDGVNNVTLDRVLQTIISNNILKIFVDGSNFGEVVRVVKVTCPNVQVYTFFHNVEVRFFWGLLRQNKTLHALAVVMVNYLAERKSVKHSDRIICLSQRDSRKLHKFYGRGATHVSPMALQDKLVASSYASIAAPLKDKYALFVGGGFYANRAGIIWFVKHVVPRISIRTCIVGRGLEDLKEVLEVDHKVELVGAVDSLVQWYRDSHFVIAPIFDGSGMKTKVAEALMFGKKIIGTPEAFSGYEDIANRVGCVCSTADEFITAINGVDALVTSSFDNESRAIYEKEYSLDAARARFIDFMGA